MGDILAPSNVERKFTRENMPDVVFINIDFPDSGWWTGFQGDPKDFVRYVRQDVQDKIPSEDDRQAAVKQCLRFVHDVSQDPEVVRKTIERLQALL